MGSIMPFGDLKSQFDNIYAKNNIYLKNFSYDMEEKLNQTILSKEIRIEQQTVVYMSVSNVSSFKNFFRLQQIEKESKVLENIYNPSKPSF